MHHVQISDPVFDRASHAAALSGRSVEAFIEKAVQMLAEDELPVTLTPEQIEICARAEADITAGRVFTSAQVRDHFAAKEGAWLKNQQP